MCNYLLGLPHYHRLYMPWPSQCSLSQSPSLVRHVMVQFLQQHDGGRVRGQSVAYLRPNVHSMAQDDLRTAHRNQRRESDLDICKLRQSTHGQSGRIERIWKQLGCIISSYCVGVTGSELIASSRSALSCGACAIWLFGYENILKQYMAQNKVHKCKRVQNSLCFFGSGFGFFFGFLSWYHLPCICNSLELESVILHGICYILAWSLCILHGICYIWPCSPSILHGICHILAFQPLICMVFATFWYFNRSCGLL